MSAVPGFKLGVPAVTTIDVLLNAYAPPVPSNLGPMYATPVFRRVVAQPRGVDRRRTRGLIHVPERDDRRCCTAEAAVMVGAAKARKSDNATNGERARYRQVLFNPVLRSWCASTLHPMASQGDRRVDGIHARGTFASQQAPAARSATSPPGRMNRSAQPRPHKRRRTTPRPFSRTAEFAIGSPNG